MTETLDTLKEKINEKASAEARIETDLIFKKIFYYLSNCKDLPNCIEYKGEKFSCYRVASDLKVEIRKHIENSKRREIEKQIFDSAMKKQAPKK